MNKEECEKRVKELLKMSTEEILANYISMEQEKNTIINDIKSILIMDICDDEKCNLIDKYLKELKEK